MDRGEEGDMKYSKIAQQNKESTQFGTMVSPTLDEPIRTDESVARDLDMGRTTFRFRLEDLIR